MAANPAQLRIVTPAQAAPDAPIEDQLALLFAAEAALQAQLVHVRLALQGARERLADADGALILPRMELLRTRYGPQVSRAPQDSLR